MTVSLTETPSVIRIAKAGSDLNGVLAEVERVTKNEAIVCYVENQGFRTYQQGEYEVIA